jgi:glycine hydroxymethyltransferase
MTLFPFPLAELRRLADELGFVLYFDGAHQAGLCAGGQFQDPLAEGADVLTGSTGKTFSGPQGGVIAYRRPEHDRLIRPVIFPALAATHQVNRVAALAIAAAEMLEFGRAYMARIVANAQALGAALTARGFTLLGAHKGFTRTHQVIVDLSAGVGGYEAARLLDRANIVANKNLLPSDRPEDWARPGGLRLGTTEAARLGMGKAEMDQIAEWFHRVLIAGEAPERIAAEVRGFREDFQTVYYCFENGVPPR